MEKQSIIRKRVLHILILIVSILLTSCASSQLYKAAETGDLEKAKKAISKGVDVNMKKDLGKYDKGITPLMMAAEKGNLDIVKLLVESGADVDAKNEDGETALMMAAHSYKGSLDIVKFFVDNGADINVKDQDEETVLHEVAHSFSSENIHIAKYFIENGLDVNANAKYSETPLMKAASSGYLNMVKFLIENGANVNAKNSLDDTPLMKAAEYGNHIDVAKFLVENGADVNAKRYSGETVLMRNVEWGTANMAKLLIENGADVHVKNKEGKTALMIAKEKGKTDIVKLFTDDYENLFKTISITNVEFSNTNNDKVIDSYGSELNEAKLKYLTPRITYDNNSSFSGNKELYVKIIDSKGNLEKGSSSPSGYTYSTSLYLYSNSKNNKTELSGWGSADGGVYDIGVYTFEVWSDGKKLYSKKFTVSGIAITDVKFANSDAQGNIVGSYDTYFESSKLKYLKPRITYNNTSSFSGNKNFYVKIIKPDGYIKEGSSSPRGYSYSSSLNIAAFDKGEAMLSGWGNDEGNSYNDGVHTFEVWSNNKKLYSKNFTVNNQQERIARQQEEQRRYEQQKREYEQQQEENMEEFINSIVGLAGAINDFNNGSSQQSSQYQQPYQQQQMYQHDNSQNCSGYEIAYGTWIRRVEGHISSLGHQDKGKSSYNRVKKNLRDAQREMRKVRNTAKSNGCDNIDKNGYEDYTPPE